MSKGTYAERLIAFIGTLSQEDKERLRLSDLVRLVPEEENGLSDELPTSGAGGGLTSLTHRKEAD
jgi:hypothetical protein